jgi:hypothetical protein
MAVLSALLAILAVKLGRQFQRLVVRVWWEAVLGPRRVDELKDLCRPRLNAGGRWLGLCRGCRGRRFDLLRVEGGDQFSKDPARRVVV